MKNNKTNNKMKDGKLRMMLLVFFTALIFNVGYSQIITPQTALQEYLNNGDSSFQWKVVDKHNARGGTLYRIVFTSQQWQGITWKHELVVAVPKKLKYDDALLFITGGSVKDGSPKLHNWDEGLTGAMGKIALTNHAVTALLWQVPNQPLYDDLTEDALISYTLHNYREDGDYSWPLLFPMTKSAIKAMDIVQELSKQKIKKHAINQFVVAGASKRGWTTWLTGANDSRVKAIAPMVIDMLNMPVSMDYHQEAWGDYSPQIEDYVKLGIVQNLDDKQGRDIVQMIDPYSYRKTLTIPKMIFIGTNDPYWPVDAIKNYIDSIPGDNHIHYVPNAGHGLGDQKQALKALNAFFGLALTNGPYPVCQYDISENEGKIELSVTASSEMLIDAILWTSDSDDRDFRDEEWTSKSLGAEKKAKVQLEMAYPESGYKAFYVDLKYKSPSTGEYTESTRMFVADSKHFLK